VALLLRKQGIIHIRPLQGGLDAWRNLGYPMETANPEPISAEPGPST